MPPRKYREEGKQMINLPPVNLEYWFTERNGRYDHLSDCWSFVHQYMSAPFFP